MSKLLRADQVPAGSGTFNLADFEREAQEIVARAHERASGILEDANRRAAEIADGAREAGRAAGAAEGREAGLAEGREAGREAGLEAARQETATVAETLLAMLKELSSRRESLIKEAEHDLLELSVRIAERVVRRELTADRSAAVRAVAEAVAMTADRSRVRVLVNPADLAALKAAREDLARTVAGLGEIEIASDESVERGGCVVRTDGGEVDARVGTQLERIAKLLTGGEADPAPASGKGARK